MDSERQQTTRRCAQKGQLALAAFQSSPQRLPPVYVHKPLVHEIESLVYVRELEEVRVWLPARSLKPQHEMLMACSKEKWRVARVSCGHRLYA